MLVASLAGYWLLRRQQQTPMTAKAPMAKPSNSQRDPVLELLGKENWEDSIVQLSSYSDRSRLLLHTHLPMLLAEMSGDKRTALYQTLANLCINDVGTAAVLEAASPALWEEVQQSVSEWATRVETVSLRASLALPSLLQLVLNLSSSASGSEVLEEHGIDRATVRLMAGMLLASEGRLRLLQGCLLQCAKFLVNYSLEQPKQQMADLLLPVVRSVLQMSAGALTQEQVAEVQMRVVLAVANMRTTWEREGPSADAVRVLGAWRDSLEQLAHQRSVRDDVRDLALQGLQ